MAGWVRRVAFMVDMGLAFSPFEANSRARISHASAYDEATQALIASGRSDYASASPESQARMARMLMAVGWLETNYGYGWRGDGSGSNNMGAITGTYQGSYFLHQDSRPDENGDGQPEVYTTKFRKYPTRTEGWVDLVRVVYRTAPVAAAGLAGDIEGFSGGLYRAHYYTGTSTVPATNVARHVSAVRNALAKADAELGPMPGAPTVATQVAQNAAGGAVVLGLLLAGGYFAFRRFRR